MRHLERTSIQELRKRYKLIIGCAATKDEFYKFYNPNMYKIDLMFDGRGYEEGEIICGHEILPVSAIRKIKEPSVCVIIYHNCETEMLEVINELLPQADTILSRLVAIPDVLPSYSTDREDQIMLNMLHNLELKNISYMDIGVCHPVVRNNTYLFYANGFTNGILVEPNPIMCELARLYRPENKVIQCGATANPESEKLFYYQRPDAPGLNTFSRDIAQTRGIENNQVEIPVLHINQIIEENFNTFPDILDIDTEGMDIELINALDTDRFKIKIICSERSGLSKEFRKIFKDKGYIHFASTKENDIFLREDLIKSFETLQRKKQLLV